MSGYLHFKKTDSPIATKIFKALTRAGNSYHHTSDWQDECYDGSEPHLAKIERVVLEEVGKVEQRNQSLEQQLRAVVDAVKVARSRIDRGQTLALFASNETKDRDARHAVDTAIQSAEALLNQTPIEPESNDGWISVEDRLPPKGASWVLVYAGGAINCMAYAAGNGWQDWTNPFHPNVLDGTITHWQPLPAPPKLRRQDRK